MQFVFAFLFFFLGCSGEESSSTTQKQPTKPIPVKKTAGAKNNTCSHDALATQTKKQLKITRNTVFARHGRAFKTKELQQYFNQQPWYKLRKDFSDSMLTQADKACVRRVRLWEKKKGKKMLDVDLTGDGKKDSVYLFDRRPAVPSDTTDDGVCEKSCFVHVGYGLFTHKLKVFWKKNGGFDQLQFGIADLDTSTPQKEIYLQHRLSWIEDPPTISEFMWVQAGKSYQQTLEASYYNEGKLDFTKPGMVGVNDAVDCVKSKVTWFSLQGKQLKQERIDEKINQQRLRDYTPPDGGDYECPACPYVFLEHGTNKVFLGEILRNQNSEDKRQWDSLPLRTKKTTVRLQIAEMKKEITYIDSLYLQVGDAKIYPESCLNSKELWCEADDQFLVLHEGEQQTFVFVIPKHVRQRRYAAELQAFGYYIPIP